MAAGVPAPFAFFPLALKQLHPILAALAMAMSSISAVSNSLCLYKAKLNNRPVERIINFLAPIAAGVLALSQWQKRFQKAPHRGYAAKKRPDEQTT